MKISSKAIAIIASIVVAGSGGLLYYLTNRDSPDVLGWMDSSWLYRKAINIENASGIELTNEDVLLEIDTSTLVTAGKLQADCDDLRFVEAADMSALDYWIEDGCNTTSTKIWVRIPILPIAGTSIYTYYGNNTASAGSLSWSGNVIMFADTTCPSGWTGATTLDDKFLYGSSTYGTAAGSASHSHTASGTSSSISTTSIEGGIDKYLGTSLTHTHTNLAAGLNTNSSVLPPYKDMVMCYNNHFLFSTGLISMFNVTTPTGWTRFADLDDTFPRGASTYGGTGGATTHTHTTTNGNTTNTTSATQSSSKLDIGSGADGSVTISTNTNINTTNRISGRSCADGGDAVNYNVSSLTSTTATVSTGSIASGCIVAGDEVLLINLAGTTTSIATLGKYETLIVESVNNGTGVVTFETEKVNFYGSSTSSDSSLGTANGTYRVMLQRVPNYSSLTVNTGITFSPSAWNGSKGGVIFFRVSGTATITGTVSASETGYRKGSLGTNRIGGGEGEGAGMTSATNGNGGNSNPSTTGFAGLWSGGGGGGKLTSSAGQAGGAGTTNSASSGGGGGGSVTRYDTLYHGYAGDGGGGGHATGGQGGNGGSSTYKGADGTTSASGAGSGAGRDAYNNRGGGGGGGSAKYGSSTLSVLTMGGGGGGGGEGQSREGGYYAGKEGANGGGIVYVAANTITVNGYIRANGGDGVNGDYSGSGGGGAGGSVKLYGNTVTAGTTRVTATGGPGDAYGVGGNGRVRIEYVSSKSGTTSPVSSDFQLTTSTYASDTHTHASASSTVSTDSNVPPYLDMVFAKADSDIYVTENNVLATSELPPLGWNRFTALDSKIPRGASTYGGTGGATTHTHTVNITTGVPSATMIGIGTGASFASTTHTHSGSAISSSVSNFPPYFTIIFAQRKISQNFTVLDEESVEDFTKWLSGLSGVWIYRRGIEVENTSGTDLTDEDVLIEIDTAALISGGKIQADCDDIRFTLNNNITKLSYWIEGGCNTSTTQIWARIPLLPADGTTIYFYYGNESAINTEESWSGNFIMYTDSLCPTGWTNASDLNGTFLYGGTTYGVTGGTSSHSHTASGTSSSISTTNLASAPSGSLTGTTTTHTHDSLSVGVDENTTVLPPYSDMTICYKDEFLLEAGLISMFDTTAPSGWTRFTGLDDIFPRANSSYGGTGGATTHTHTTTTGNTSSGPTGTQTAVAPIIATGGTEYTSGSYTVHRFTSSSTLSVLIGGINTEYLVVAGGGGSGGRGATNWGPGGGGGAGGMRTGSMTFSIGDKSVVVGDGAARASNASGNNGGSSSINGVTAIGGGGGGRSYNYNGLGGGSGGGASPRTASGWGYGGAGTAGQGYAGGNSYYVVGTYNGAGGGGAGGVGSNGQVGTGAAGPGVASSITGTSVTYATGGIGGSATDSFRDGAANTGNGGGSVKNGLWGSAGGSGIVVVRYLTPSSTSFASSTHTHTSTSASVDSASNVPPYLKMIFGKADSGTISNENYILMTSVLPPLGWNRFTELDNKFPMGSDTYGGTGGATTHTHNVDISTGAPSATINGYGTGSSFADSTHTHSGSATSSSVSNLPTYTTVIYSERKVPKAITLLAEETIPSPPTDLLCEGETTPTDVADTTPEFSAIFNDDDTSDTGNYYQIMVNTQADFNGTVMWNTLQRPVVTPVVNHNRSADISYNGTTLQWGTTYYWKIKFWDQSEAEGRWSEVSEFTMNTQPDQPSFLLVDGVENNTKTSNEPYFSAIFSDYNSTNTGNYYQLIVNTQEDFEGTEMWDSAKTAFITPIVNGTRSSDIQYVGTELLYNTTYYWKVKFWDNHDLGSEFSTTSNFLLASPPNAPTDLEADGQTNPIILYSRTPSFTAIYSDDNEDSSLAYQIQVNSSSLFTGTVMWDSGKVNTNILSGERSPEYTYAGLPLNSTHIIYYWRIRFWNTDDMRSAWSEVAHFTDALATFNVEGITFQGIKID